MITDIEEEPLATVTEHEAQQIARANETGRPPVVFIHGLWLLANCWERARRTSRH